LSLVDIGVYGSGIVSVSMVMLFWLDLLCEKVCMVVMILCMMWFVGVLVSLFSSCGRWWLVNVFILCWVLVMLLENIMR